MLFAYFGPETMLPLTSIVAAVVGFFLMFGKLATRAAMAAMSAVARRLGHKANAGSAGGHPPHGPHGPTIARPKRATTRPDRIES